MHPHLILSLRGLTIIALACCFSSCSMLIESHPPSDKDVSKLKKGMTEPQVRRSLKIHSTPQFRTFEGNNTTEGGLAYLGQRPVGCYLIYENGALASIHQAVSHPTINTMRDGIKSDRILKEHPRQRLRRVYQQQNFLNDTAAFRQATTDIPRQKSYNILPAFVIVAPLMVAMEPLTLTALAADKSKQARWNVTRVDPGDTISSLTKKFGKPIAIVDGTYHFGPPGTEKENPASANKRLMVEVREGKVTAAFGDDFYKDP